MRTTVIGTLVRIPTTNEPTVMVAYPKNCIEKVRVKNTTNARLQIYGGMIHAFTNLGICSNGTSCRIMVFKCIIPKGTIYYKGTNDDICAKKMLIVEKVK